MSNISYYRVSTRDQSVESQRSTARVDGITIDREFLDEGISGAIPAMDRPGFKSLLEYVRAGDTLYVHAVDRLGRDAIDVQSTIRMLIHKGVMISVRGLGLIGQGAGELIVAVLAQIADMERQRIAERTASGRAVARQSLAATGKTHRGKTSLGRPVKVEAVEIRRWRAENSASIRDTASYFSLSISTVKRHLSAK